MSVEARYTPGDAILLGAGDRWLLMTDPGDEDVLDRLWAAVTETRAADVSFIEQVLAIAEKAFEGDPPALAVVDLSTSGSTAVSRGAGHVHVNGPARELSLDSGRDPSGVSHSRPLVAGVVSSSRLWLMPLSVMTAPSPTAPSPRPASGPLIDGIPDFILAARGPDGPPPRPEHPGDSIPAPGLATHRPEPAYDENPHTADPVTVDSMTVDPVTVDPVTVDPVTVDPVTTDAVGDRDEAAEAPPAHVETREGQPGPSHLQTSTTQQVWAVNCPQGHLTPPDSRMCRVCRAPVAPQQPHEAPRPILGGLRLPTGEVVPLDRGVILGRKPAPAPDSADWPHLVHLPSDHSFVSRMHVQIKVDGWQVLARDLGSRGGTMLAMPGHDPVRMRPQEDYVLDPGAVLDLADVYEVRFETGAVTQR